MYSNFANLSPLRGFQPSQWGNIYNPSGINHPFQPNQPIQPPWGGQPPMWGGGGEAQPPVMHPQPAWGANPPISSFPGQMPTTRPPMMPAQNPQYAPMHALLGQQSMMRRPLGRQF